MPLISASPSPPDGGQQQPVNARQAGQAVGSAGADKHEAPGSTAARERRAERKPTRQDEAKRNPDRNER